MFVFTGGFFAQSAIAQTAESGLQRGGPPQLASLVGLGLLLLAVLLFKVGRVGMTLLASACCPEAVGRARASVAAWPIRLFLLGTANGLAFLIVTSVLLSQAKAVHVFAFFALALVVLFTCLTILGMAGIFAWIGRRISATGGETSAEILRGGVVWEAATLAPLIGLLAEFVALPVAIGAGTLLLFSRGDQHKREEISKVTQTPDAM